MKFITNERPTKEGFRNYQNYMEYYSEVLDDQISGKIDEDKIRREIKELISYQDPDGSWKLIQEDYTPYDAIVEYWKKPTVLSTAILINYKLKNKKIKIKNFDKSLNEALESIIKGKLSGHGFAAFNFKIKSLNILIKAGLKDFLIKYPNYNKKFADFILEEKSNLEKSLNANKTRFDYNEEFKLRLREILNLMENKKGFIFVYGRLMKKDGRKHKYLKNSKLIGEGVLEGYSLYDLGYYPGIVKEEGKVKGEIYEIPVEDLKNIDSYEGEGLVYKREKLDIRIENETIKANAYVYLQNVKEINKIDFNI